MNVRTVGWGKTQKNVQLSSAGTEREARGSVREKKKIIIVPNKDLGGGGVGYTVEKAPHRKARGKCVVPPTLRKKTHSQNVTKKDKPPTAREGI